MEDEAYEMLMKKIQKIADAEEFCLDSAELQNIAYLFLALVEKAKPFDGLINGEVMQTLFPKTALRRTSDNEYGLRPLDSSWIIWFKGDWWNRKWGE